MVEHPNAPARSVRREFNGWIRRAVVPGTPFPDWQTESSAQRIRGRLLPLTPSLAPLAEQLEIAAAHDVTVLIEGETGTGKTHLAKLIHDGSRRAAQRFLAVSCGSLPGSLAAEEFFGRAGGLSEAKLGKFEAAGSGIVWATHPLSGNANQAVRPGIFRAFDADDLTHELWNSEQNAARDAVGKLAKFAPPTIARGRVYLPTFSNALVVYGLLP